VYASAAALLYFAFRKAPLAEIWNTLQQLRLPQIGLILLVNAAVIACISMRWWVIVRAEHRNIPLMPLVGYRLSVFALSYFTPGPQVGGEPLQVLLLERNHGVSRARATAAVIMDKLLEFLANFLLICVGAAAALQLGLVSRYGIQATAGFIPLGALLLWPIVHLLLLYRQEHPISSLLRAASTLIGTPKWVRLIMVSERMAARFVRRRARWLMAALAFSILAWAGMALEYFLLASFLSAHLTAAQTLAALSAALLAFLVPLPGGMGALEASQVLALGAFGQPAAIAISLTLLMRGRDMVNGVLGLLLAGRPVAA
jgi:uncharacterized protein (TIRG00374 family)